MDLSGYTTLTRQSGLMSEMQIIANNIANASTTGFRQEGVIFSEYVVGTDTGPSVSMAQGDVRNTSFLQGNLTQTGSQLDFGIEGEGFFLIETPNGERITRAGSFTLSQAGDLVTHDGYNVLDAGGAPIFIPPDTTKIDVAGDGTISADGRLLGQLGLVQPQNPRDIFREGGVMFRPETPLDPVEEAHIVQGHLESSNVDTILQVSRMIEVQRAYELGQSFLDSENQRSRDAIRAFGQER
ncbi:MAG: flagellar hook-basal body complex protein [Pseudomonadota bacterium]